ncbi:hypothetical protein FJY68_01805 [candidate division WOR-3 bacterium]|uniref:Peptidase S74 domain-containing protein n=1 Tax=candidate division WOR-3 bacterium TaxID=2052148 RepID=A0A938BQG2_UNCW3|nr:hypothetical protein [candidate division WOR-3 bacterium]
MKFTILLPALFCAFTFAADNAVRDRQSIVHSPSSMVDGADAIAIPQMLSYQGQLTDTLGRPVADSTYSVAFRLYTVPSGGSSFWNETQSVTTKAGLFSVLLGAMTPIGSVPAAGGLYLGMAVGGGPELVPRLRVVSVAYAYKADTAGYALASAGGDNAWVRGTPDSVLFTIRQLGIARGGSGNMLYGAARSTHVNLGVACTTGLSGQDYRYTTVAGGQVNVAGMDWSTVGGGCYNDARGSCAVVGGGGYNVADGGYSVVAGGSDDTASAYWSAVGGGNRNVANGQYSFVGGGNRNLADAIWTVVGGGSFNTADESLATVGGGSYNTASGSNSAVPGGFMNSARGYSSLAAGSYARSNHDGSFVWSDGAVTAAESVYTTGILQFRARARGGAWFFSNSAMTTGAYLAPNSNSWESACDSMTKEDFRPVDRKTLLDKVASLRARDYKMKDQNDGTRHIGPVAQDFHSAFGYGGNETSINLADADGVLLAAVQALFDEAKTDRIRIAQLEAELA